VVSLLRDRRAAERALTASGQTITASGLAVGTRIAADMMRRLNAPWQRRALLYYDLIPEVWYAAQFYSRHMSKVELRVEEYDPEKDEWNPAPDSPASGILDRIQDKAGGRSDLLGTYGRLRFLVGDKYLTCFNPDQDDEYWEILSRDELRPRGDGRGYERVRAEGWQPEPLEEAPEDAFEEVPENTVNVYRLWRRHPRFSMQADSPMHAVMDVCEELLLLTLAVRARARSRLARAGILKVPQEISLPPVEPAPGDDPQEDPFMVALTAHMEAGIIDEGSAAAVVPMIVRGPMEALKALDQLVINTEQSYPEAQLRTEAISRFANGADMPREALLGTADVNHWGAWQIDQQTWEAHVQPVLEEFCNELTGVILRPTLEGGGDSQPSYWRVWYDPVKVTNHPDRGKDAQDTFDRGELSGEALRLAKGFDSSDEPSQTERARWIGVRTRDSGLAWTGVPTVKSGGEAETNVAPLPGNQDTPDDGGETAPEDGGTGNDATPAAPSPDTALQPRVIGAAEAALWQARKTAGSRIIGRLPNAARRQFANMPRHQVYARLGRAWLAEQNGGSLSEPLELVKGSTDALAHTLEAWGYPPERVQTICGFVESHAAATLDQAMPPALPPILLNL
jgi:hypothetical protein